MKLCLVCKWICGKMRWTKDQVRTIYLMLFVLIFIQKLIHSFLMLGSEGKHGKHFFPTTWHCTASCFFRASFLFGFCVDLHIHLSRKAITSLLTTEKNSKGAVLTHLCFWTIWMFCFQRVHSQITFKGFYRHSADQLLLGSCGGRGERLPRIVGRKLPGMPVFRDSLP